MVIICKGNVIRAEDLPIENLSLSKDMRFQSNHLIKRASKSAGMPDFRRTKKDLIERFEKKYLKSLLEKNQWNISQSAGEIKMQRSSLQRLIRKHGLRE
jgi:DNA-binding NtrC family response regulator